MIQQTNKHIYSLALQRLQPLWSVIEWELFRYRMMRFSKLMIVGIAAFFVLGAWSWAYAFTYLPYASTSVLGMTLEVPTTFTWTLAVTTPFLLGGLVTRDRKQRMHELVMTTPVPTWAYVWGRYLAGLIVCFALAALAFPLILLMNGIFYALYPSSVPVSNVGEILMLETVAMLPIILVTGLSFCLCTLLPGRETLLKLLVLLGWLITWYSGAALGWAVADGRLPEKWEAWDPTTVALPIRLMLQMMAQSKGSSLASPTHVVDVQRAIVARQHLPDLSPWLLTHLLYALLGLSLVALTAVLFKRFRIVLDWRIAIVCSQPPGRPSRSPWGSGARVMAHGNFP